MAQKALLCGINDYPGSPLNGCLNDVADWWKIVTELGGFSPDNVRALCDRRADTGAIRERMHWLRDGVVAGDEVIWTFSGHGSEVRRRDIFDGGLSEVVDQCICPVNVNDPDYWDTGVITDKEIRDWLAGFPAGVKITLILDCCHSGTGTRSLNPHGKPRYLQPPLDIRLRHQTVGESRKDIPVHKAGRGLGAATNSESIVGPGIIAVSAMNHVLFAGCRSDQTSADAEIGGSVHGAMTYFLGRTVRSNPKRSRIEVHTAARAAILEAGYSQEQQLEGPQALLSAPFLGF